MVSGCSSQCQHDVRVLLTVPTWCQGAPHSANMVSGCSSQCQHGVGCLVAVVGQDVVDGSSSSDHVSNTHSAIVIHRPLQLHTDTDHVMNQTLKKCVRPQHFTLLCAPKVNRNCIGTDK
ncbi:hypothetical protein NL108_013058 [Boleophthalmus pectinirostris]|nr:hypothetical protein NL108_013058 [Boleophthalmus pectinirostris]